MRCSKAERYISQKLDGEIKARHLAELNQHLNVCSSCRATLKAYSDLQSNLQAAPAAEYPAWLHHRIMANLPISSKPSRVQRWGLSYAAPSLAIMLSLYVGTLVGIKGYEVSSQSQSTAESTEQISYISFGENSLIGDYDE